MKHTFLRKFAAGVSLAALLAGPIASFSYEMPAVRAAELPAPVLKVTFDDATATDVTGRENHGEVVGSPEFAKGVKGQAIHLKNPSEIAGEYANAEQYVNFGKTEDLKFGTDDFSIAFWYKADGEDSSEVAVVGNKDWNSGGNEGLVIGDMRNGMTLNFTAQGAGRIDTSRITEATDNTWHYITATFDRDGAMTLYVDGNEMASKDISSQAGKSIDVADFVLGADGYKRFGVEDSYIDEFEVYKEVLTPEQIAELMVVEETETGKPVLNVTFDDETANDTSGNDNHGMITGAVEFVDGVEGKAVHIVNPAGIAGEYAQAEQYVNFGQPEELKFGTDSFSILFWYKADGTDSSEVTVVGNKDWNSGGNDGLVIGDMRNGMTLNFTAQGAGRIDTSRIQEATDNTWHHIAAVFNRTGDMVLYVDGEEATRTSINSVQGKSIDVGDFVLGADGYKRFGVEDSYIDEFQVYKTALTEEELSDMIAPYVLKSRIAEYETLIAESDASTGKKDKFAAVIAEVKEASQGVTAPDEVNAFMEQLRKAYNEFCGPEEGLAEFVVLSDTHVPSSTTDSSALIFIDALEDVKTYFPRVKAIVNPGDFSCDGYENEFKAYFDIIGQYDSDLVFMNALGNHDVRWKSGWNEIYDRYMRYNGKYMEETDGAVYFDRWVDGYHFIVLNTEWDLKDRAYISDAQLKWLDETMAEGAEDGKPIFITMHQALRDTYWNSNDWDDGVQDFALKEVLRKYPQTIMFTGHIHNGLGKLEVVETDYGTMVDIPSFRSNDYGNGRGQIGYHVTIYEDKVQLSMRDYKADEWLPEYNYTIDMNPANKPAGKVLDVNFDDETAKDVSGHGNDGTIVGNVEFTDGVSGKAIHIVNSEDKESAEQYVEFGLADDLRFGEDDFSILFWYKGEEEKKVEGSILANKDWDSGANQGFAIGNFSGGNPGIGLNYTAEGSQRKDTSRYTAATDGKWHHIAATFDRDGLMVLYIDGKAAGSKDISEAAGKTIDVDTLQLVLGADANGKYPVHDSYIDELKIYRKVLKEAELETVCTPFEITTGETEVRVSWDMSESIDEPAYIILGGKRYDIASSDTSKVITGLESGKEYSMMLVTREKANSGNLKNAYTLSFETEEPEVVAPDKTNLKKLIDDSEKYVTAIDKYTPATGNAFMEAMNAAKKVFDNAEATQDKVDEAETELQQAVSGLKEAANKDKLEQLIKKAEGIDLSKYTDASAKEVQETLAKAKEVVSDAEVTQEEADAAYSRLQQAVSGLEEAVNKDKLEQLIKKAEEIDLSKYTESSAKKVQEALAKVKEVFADAKATQEKVDEAEKELQAAVDQLKEKPDKPDKPSEPDKDNSDKKDNNESKTENETNNNSTANADSSTSQAVNDKPAKTGDNTILIPWFVLMLAACAGGIGIRQKRQR